ncbi:PREDICTED: uncharacterized protein LOC109227181 [Nicotiana attenuata]|uniref:Senescence regulator n=1 Tax=Nicotiana attenuata TaxID=49451 RepID=A0A1J6IUK3_NICAT|nr:PREDICTED: uncharacterized protein LOC109227181 [Nicotiana attenuata]OIT02475.1 hypothetical protein A4A49_07065 [Nicotiana attenuata]
MEDFQEEDIWAISMKERKGFSGSVVKRKLATAPKVIPRAKTTAINSHESTVPQQSSAPVNIPDWSKIYNKKKSSRFLKNGSWDSDENFVQNIVVEDEDCDDFSDGMVPPHEYIARRVARSQIAPFSMCEGIGRTLKGRDLSKLRNAILTKTGFLE